MSLGRLSGGARVTEPRDTIAIVEDDLDAGRGLLFHSAEAFLDECDLEHLGCVILDLRLPGRNGLELHRDIHSRVSDLPVILVSAYADVPTTVQAMRQGVLSVLEKPCDAELLTNCVHEALELRHSRCTQHNRREQLRLRFDGLHPRERETLQLIAAGEANKTIARRLGVSRRTVDRIRAAVLEKIGVASAFEAACMLGEVRPLLSVPGVESVSN
jgi:FixJ family two-component response regulator